MSDINSRMRKSYAQHREENLERDKAWREKNPEKWRAINRKNSLRYYRVNKEWYLECQRQRRIRRLLDE